MKNDLHKVTCTVMHPECGACMQDSSSRAQCLLLVFFESSQRSINVSTTRKTCILKSALFLKRLHTHTWIRRLRTVRYVLCYHAALGSTSHRVSGKLCDSLLSVQSSTRVFECETCCKSEIHQHFENLLHDDTPTWWHTSSGTSVKSTNSENIARYHTRTKHTQPQTLENTTKGNTSETSTEQYPLKWFRVSTLWPLKHLVAKIACCPLRPTAEQTSRPALERLWVIVCILTTGQKEIVTKGTQTLNELLGLAHKWKHSQVGEEGGASS